MERAVGECAEEEEYNIIVPRPPAVEIVAAASESSSAAVMVVVAWKDIDVTSRAAAIFDAGQQSGNDRDKQQPQELPYICVHGSFVLRRLASEARGSSFRDRMCTVSVIQCDSPVLRGHELMFMAQGIHASRKYMRNPGVTHLIDYAAGIAGKISEDLARTRPGKRRSRLPPRITVLGDAMRQDTQAHIKRGHGALKKALLRSEFFAVIAGHEDAGGTQCALREAALQGEAVVRSLPCNVLGHASSKENKRAQEAMCTGLRGFSGRVGGIPLLESEESALERSAGAYLRVLEYLHERRLTQAVLKLLDMRAPGLLTDIYLAPDLCLFKKCRSDVGVALFFIWLYHSWIHSGRTSSFNKHNLEHVLDCHEHLLQQFEQQCGRVDVDDDMFQSVEDLPRDWSAALSLSCRHKAVAVLGTPSASFRVVFPRTEEKPETRQQRRRRGRKAKTKKPCKTEGALSTDAAIGDSAVHGARSQPSKKRRTVQSGDAGAASSSMDAGTGMGSALDKSKSSPGAGVEEERRDDGAASPVDTERKAVEAGVQDVRHQGAQAPSPSTHYQQGTRAGARALNGLYEREGKCPAVFGRDAINRGYVKLCGVAGTEAFTKILKRRFELALDIATLVALHFSTLRVAHGFCSFNMDSTGSKRDKNGHPCCASHDGCHLRGESRLPCPCLACTQNFFRGGGSVVLYDTRAAGTAGSLRQHRACQEYVRGLSLPGVRRVVLRRNGVHAVFKRRKHEGVSGNPVEHPGDDVGDEVLILRRHGGPWSVADPGPSSMDDVDSACSWFLQTTQEYAAAFRGNARGGSVADLDQARGFVDTCVGLCVAEGGRATGEGLPEGQIAVLTSSMELHVALPGATGTFRYHADEGETPLRDVLRPFIAVTPYPTLNTAGKPAIARPSPASPDVTNTKMCIDIRTVPLPMNAFLSAKLQQRSSPRATEVTEAEFWEASLALQIAQGDIFVQRCDTSHGVEKYSAATDVDSAVSSLQFVEKCLAWKQVRPLLQRLLSPQVVLLLERPCRVAE